MNFNNLNISIQLDNYNKCDNDSYKCYFVGSIIYKDKIEGEESILNILHDFSYGSIDWNQLHGAFRIIIIRKTDNAITLFTDNAGLLCFYYHEGENVLSDSFIELLESTKQHSLNMKAVASFAKDGLVYGNHTICKEIRRFSSECYFVWNGIKIKCHTKLLKSFEEINCKNSVSNFSKNILKSISGKKTASIVTGGFDSRWILSILLAENISSDLFISGSDDLIDVKIAKQIAGKLNKPLTVCDGKITTQEEFDEAFQFSDGQFNCVNLYRLYLLQNTIKIRGYDIVLGGVGGEFYKNSFINQDFPIYWGTLNANKFVKQKVSYNNINAAYFTDEFVEFLSSIESSIQAEISQIKNSRKKSKQAIDYGYWVLKQRMVALSNSNIVPQIALLVERNPISIPYKLNPYSLEMNKFQRKEISKNAPCLSNILTDRRVSTNSNSLNIIKDIFVNYLFLLKVYTKRVFSKNKSTLAHTKHSFSSSVIEINYKESFICCQKAGVFKKDILFDNVDRKVLDNIFPVGILISKYFNDSDQQTIME